MITLNGTYATPNKSARSRRPTTIVLHATGTRSHESPLKWLTSPKSKVSAHYVIATDGTVYKLAPVSMATWHAGRSVGPDGPGVNGYSVGIEIVNPNDGKTPYTQDQIDAVDSLCRHIAASEPTVKWLTTHAEIAVPKGRKTDPRGWDVARTAKASHLRVWHAG